MTARDLFDFILGLRLGHLEEYLFRDVFFRHNSTWHREMEFHLHFSNDIVRRAGAEFSYSPKAQLWLTGVGNNPAAPPSFAIVAFNSCFLEAERTAEGAFALTALGNSSSVSLMAALGSVPTDLRALQENALTISPAMTAEQKASAAQSMRDCLQRYTAPLRQPSAA